MKNRLLLSFLISVALFASCNKKPIDDVPEKKEPTMVEFGVKSQVPGTTTVTETFAVGDKIGMYMIKTSDAATNSFLYSNVGYVCNPTNWRAINDNEAMQWFQGDPNVDFYGYHPFVGDGTGAVKSVTPTGNDVEIVYNLPLDQSNIVTVADRRPFDLMHVANKNIPYAGNNPVEMNFKHMLARVRFDVKLLRTTGQNILNNKANITKVEIVGNQIASKMTLNLKSATYAGATFAGPIVWNGTKEYDVVLDYSTVEALTVADFLVIPFDPQYVQNTIKFYVSYTEDGVAKNRVFTSYINPVTSASDIEFKPNKYNIVTALISLDNNSIQITSTIVDWDTSDHTTTSGL